jgi:hypothetical protein
LYENTYPESDMQKGIEMLSEVKEVIINAFEAKTTGWSVNRLPR